MYVMYLNIINKSLLLSILVFSFLVFSPCNWEGIHIYLKIVSVSVKMKFIFLILIIISISQMIKCSLLCQQNLNHTCIEPRDGHSLKKTWIANSLTQTVIAIGVFVFLIPLLSLSWILLRRRKNLLRRP